MKPAKILVFLTWLTSHLFGCRGYNILVLGVFPFNSHVMMLNVISNELAAQGHNVTFVSVKPGKVDPRINLIKNDNVMSENMDSHDFLETIGKATPIQLLTMLWDMGIDGTDKILNKPELKNIIYASNDTSFDAIIAETYFLGETLAAGFSQKFNCPIINYQPIIMSAQVAYMTGNPFNPAYMADYKMSFTSNMGFWERLDNLRVSLHHLLYQEFVYFPAQDALMRKYFAHLGAAQWHYLADILRERQALTLVDSNHIITDSIAYAPNIVEVGGLHIKPGGPLPQNIADFISSRKKHGIIYFAMGSHIGTENLAEWRLERLIRLFSSLPQGVLWRLDSPELSKRLPKNVLISKWFPQNDILAHPACRLFITHGGIHSAFESLHHGVPMLIIPIFADQKQNGARAFERGYGDRIDFQRFEYEELSSKVNAILNEPRFKQAASRISRILQSAPVSPLQRAIQSIEYAIAYGGAAHLKTRATHLTWYQLLMLDVLGAWALATGILIYALVRAVKEVGKRLRKSRKGGRKKDKKRD